MNRTASRLAAVFAAGRQAVAAACSVRAVVSVITLMTFVAGTVGLPVGEIQDCTGSAASSPVCASRLVSADAGDRAAIRPPRGGCCCAGKAQASGTCCCARKPVPVAKRSCCEKSSERQTDRSSQRTVHTRTSPGEVPFAWTSCPCGPKSTLVLFVSGDPRLLPTVVEMRLDPPSPEFAAAPRLLDPQAIVSPDPRPPRLLSC